MCKFKKRVESKTFSEKKSKGSQIKVPEIQWSGNYKLGRFKTLEELEEFNRETARKIAKKLNIKGDE